jgi:hypothetical protein
MGIPGGIVKHPPLLMVASSDKIVRTRMRCDKRASNSEVERVGYPYELDHGSKSRAFTIGCLHK